MKEIIGGGKVQFVFEEVATKDKAAEDDKPAPTSDPVQDELSAQYERAKKGAG